MKKSISYNIYLEKRTQYFKSILKEDYLKYYVGPKDHEQIKRVFDFMDKVYGKTIKSLEKQKQDITLMYDALSSYNDLYANKNSELNVMDVEFVNNINKLNQEQKDHLANQIKALDDEINTLKDYMVKSIDIKIRKDFDEVLKRYEKLEDESKLDLLKKRIIKN